MKKKEYGFTLIELMIVIAIIGIIASIALPSYQDYIARSQMSEGLNLAGGQKSAVTEYRSNRGVWPSSNQEAGISAPSNIYGKYVEKVTITATASAGSIEATMRNTGVADRVKGKVLTLKGVETNGAFAWSSTTNVSTRVLPASSRDK